MDVTDDLDQVCRGRSECGDQKAVLQKPTGSDECFHAWLQDELSDSRGVTPLKVEGSVHGVEVDGPQPDLVQVAGT